MTYVKQCTSSNEKKRSATWSKQSTRIDGSINEKQGMRFVKKMCGGIFAPILDDHWFYLPVWQQPTYSKAYPWCIEIYTHLAKYITQCDHIDFAVILGFLTERYFRLNGLTLQLDQPCRCCSKWGKYSIHLIRFDYIYIESVRVFVNVYLVPRIIFPTHEIVVDIGALG
jgi:hypothetical protein